MRRRMWQRSRGAIADAQPLLAAAAGTSGQAWSVVPAAATAVAGCGGQIGTGGHAALPAVAPAGPATTHGGAHTEVWRALPSGQIGGRGQTITGVVAPLGVPDAIGHGRGRQRSGGPVTPVAAPGAPGTASGHGNGGQGGVGPVGPLGPAGSSGSPTPSVTHQIGGQMRCGPGAASRQTCGGAQSVAPVGPVGPAGSTVSQRQGGMHGAARWCERRWRRPRRGFAAAFAAVARLEAPTFPVPAVVVATGQSSAAGAVRAAAPCALPNAGTAIVSAATSTTPASVPAWSRNPG
jgi:hypothetical protein